MCLILRSWTPILYIPIWLYSNDNWHGRLKGKILGFTFQSGYIPTPILHLFCSYSLLLYIPIWLYSNNNVDLIKSSPTSFTFQSGYIPTVNLRNLSPSSSPTLHSNLVIFQHQPYKYRFDCSQLYIPIWLYSNSLLFSD